MYFGTGSKPGLIGSVAIGIFSVCYVCVCVCACGQDAFSLLAYSDPWNSPVGYQLTAVQREPVCMALNSAILGTLYKRL